MLSMAMSRDTSIKRADFFFAALDMVTDRYTTTCLLVFFLFAWSRWSLAFRELIPFDLTLFFAHVCYIRHRWLWAS
ncbi:hypothetical protein DL95DRAFT_379857 [Leptodontidium sp. 2 PMI_412]|nr:hypothetical protein DL95DRAFT_379857 [Leptodontidium sp. 2 PMI_412]